MGLVNVGLLFISSVVGLGLIHIASKKRVTRMDANRRLQEQVRQTAEQMNSLVLRLQVVQESERKALAAVLHDQVGQYLTGLNLNLKILQNNLPEASPEVSTRLQESLQLVEETTRKIRDVMADLHPPVLEEYGLPAAIKWLCDDFCARTGIITRVQGDKNGGRLPARIETILYRHVQEALNNVLKHANATRVDVELDWGEESFSLLVKDNGKGFDPRARRAQGAQPHWGFLSMQQRAASIGARLEIDSAPGKGAQVLVRLGRHAHDD